MATSKNRSTFRETYEYEKVRVAPLHNGGAYIVTSNGRAMVEIGLTKKQIKALIKQLKRATTLTERECY